MYHYSWSVLKRFWLLGFVIGLLKVSYTACPGNICFFFFLTTEPQPGGYFNITPHSNLANAIILRSRTPCKHCGPLNIFAPPTCQVEQKALKN